MENNGYSVLNFSSVSLNIQNGFAQTILKVLIFASIVILTNKIKIRFFFCIIETSQIIYTHPVYGVQLFVLLREEYPETHRTAAVRVHGQLLTSANWRIPQWDVTRMGLHIAKIYALSHWKDPRVCSTGAHDSKLYNGLVEAINLENITRRWRN